MDKRQLIAISMIGFSSCLILIAVVLFLRDPQTHDAAAAGFSYFQSWGFLGVMVSLAMVCLAIGIFKLFTKAEEAKPLFNTAIAFVIIGSVVSMMYSCGTSWVEWTENKIPRIATPTPSSYSSSSSTSDTTSKTAPVKQRTERKTEKMSRPNYGLSVGSLYQFPGEAEVYLYKSDGKLHWIASEEAFRRMYKCDPDLPIANCRIILDMPSSVPRNDTSLFGSTIY